MAKDKGVQVSATISKELDQALEDHRWSVRMTKTELVRTAVEEYAAKHDLLPYPPKPADSDEPHIA